MGMLTIERLGGFGGFGMPGSRIRSEGRRALSELSPTDQAAIESLFRTKPAKPSAPVADGFRYRITRGAGSAQETVEVPEASVPEALRSCVRDELM